MAACFSPSYLPLSFSLISPRLSLFSLLSFSLISPHLSLFSPFLTLLSPHLFLFSPLVFLSSLPLSVDLFLLAGCLTLILLFSIFLRPIQVCDTANSIIYFMLFPPLFLQFNQSAKLLLSENVEFYLLHINECINIYIKKIVN